MPQALKARALAPSGHLHLPHRAATDLPHWALIAGRADGHLRHRNSGRPDHSVLISTTILRSSYTKYELHKATCANQWRVSSGSTTQTTQTKTPRCSSAPPSRDPPHNLNGTHLRHTNLVAGQYTAWCLSAPKPKRNRPPVTPKLSCRSARMKLTCDTEAQWQV